jgi:hypothetical protein
MSLFTMTFLIFILCTSKCQTFILAIANIQFLLSEYQLIIKTTSAHLITCLILCSISKRFNAVITNELVPSKNYKALFRVKHLTYSYELICIYYTLVSNNLSSTRITMSEKKGWLDLQWFGKKRDTSNVNFTITNFITQWPHTDIIQRHIHKNSTDKLLENLCFKYTYKTHYKYNIKQIK